MLRLRQAQVALNDGRLDEAHRLLEAPSLREHRKGQRLVNRLARRFGDRAREHLEAGQPRAALADCGLAIALAGPKPAFVALRDEAQTALEHGRAAKRRRDEATQAAREQLAQGRLTMAEALLDGSDAEDDALLRQRAQARRRLAEPCLDRAQAALKSGDLEEACPALLEARGHHAGHPRLSPLIRRATDAAVEGMQRCLREGRLASARTLIEHAETLSPGNMRVGSMREALAQCDRAAEDLRRGRMRSCEAALTRLCRSEPKAKWAAEMAAAAGRAAQDLEHLRAGPLGSVTLASGTQPVAPPRHSDRRPVRQRGLQTHDRPASPRGRSLATGGAALPEPFLLTIDGAGTFIVFTEPEVRVGPISAPTAPDLPLVTDPSMPPAVLRRTDGGYIVRAERPVRVGEPASTERLLRHGESAALSPRCRMTLTQPHPASGTALLRFSGARLPRADIRGAVLLDRELLLGPTSPAHVVTPGLAAQVALVRHGHGLVARGPQTPHVDGNAMSTDAALPLDTPIDLGGLTITLSTFA